ncbi:methylated-DNA--[protein]-cysteine S-methyltransferase [Nocardioides caldifontis]|uniref:methylated-DNA--[protein]-cysteine S-methyltransferase n=1 Tax=Nocardioides caldifontis TaxID=2588938 RepID=UPI0011DF3F70|nr:methylated-DNA--[protein]-cysteine S-methyltransferase [Nocardioides caldifontis]
MNDHETVTADLRLPDGAAGLLDGDPALLERLHAGLVREAAGRHLLDVAYTTVSTPVGRLLVAGTELGLVRVAYEAEGHDRVLELLADRVGPRVLRGSEPVADAVAQLEAYFDGDRRGFDLRLDLRLASGFRRAVVEQLRAIGFGETRSYAEVARATGSPGAVRAVGTACARNPLPVVVPCHRVVRSDGTPGEYVGGPAAKATLLALERG